MTADEQVASADAGTTFEPGGRLRADLTQVADLVPVGSRVLDLGCGSGTLLRHLIDVRQCTGTGVEIDPEMVLAAISIGVPVIELDLDRQLGEFADDSYDVVILSRTLQAVRRPGQVLAEMARISQHLIVSMPNFGLWRNRLRLARGHMPQSKDLPFSWHDTPNLHFATLVDLEHFFEGQGLLVERRIALREDGRPLRGNHSFNLMAGAAVYRLHATRA